MSDFLETLRLAFEGLPGARLVVLAGLLLLAPLAWLWMYRRRSLSVASRRALGGGIALLSGVLIFAPGLWQATSNAGPFDNPGLPFVALGMVYYGIPVAIACCVPSGVVGLLAALVERVRSDSSKWFDARSAGLVWTVLFVLTMSFVTWFGVGLGMVG